MAHDPNEPKRKYMNISPTMHSVNLDTCDAKGRRESLIITPRQVVEIYESQARSREFQKLVGAKFIVDVTAAGIKREQRAREMGV